MEASERNAAGVAAWVRAGAALSAARARELRALTDDDAREAIGELLSLLERLPPKEGGSGLVEQQRRFARLRWTRCSWLLATSTSCAAGTGGRSASSGDWRSCAGETLQTCSAEDLVVMKVFAGRDGDWADVAGVVSRQAGRLDAATVWDELDVLLAVTGDQQAADRLAELLPDPR